MSAMVKNSALRSLNPSPRYEPRGYRPGALLSLHSLTGLMETMT